ncbi:MAG: hypothetical protein E7014_01935 [Alphaproteobacteria bacterium]|nr:hypothetical protein [Alphaproteobacteria bacterium]MBQ8557222.1 hypothetical protein [Alphaproteobacteria bacterium]
MEQQLTLPESIIIPDILDALMQEPEKYALTSLRGLDNLKELAFSLSLNRVKSIRGTFSQAEIIGTYLASGLYKKRQNKLSESDIIELCCCPSIPNQHFEDLSKNKNYTERLQLSLIYGFETGIRMGQYFYKHKNCYKINNILELVQHIRTLKNTTPCCKKIYTSNRLQLAKKKISRQNTN